MPRSYGTYVPHRCFADEIAIDFPDVGRVVDGMRDAFFGDAPRRDVRDVRDVGDVSTVSDVSSVLAAEVCVSRREAACGLIVHFALPIRGTCPKCGGRGESWTEICADCDGTGDSLFNHPVRLAVPAGVADGATFRFRVTSPQTCSVRVEVRVAIQPSLV